MRVPQQPGAHEPEAVHYKSTGDALGGLFSGDAQGVFASVGWLRPA